ncbi:MAG: Photosystem I reaction center subunit IX [Cyanobacteria bacterium P01_H01_bin.15]
MNDDFAKFLSYSPLLLFAMFSFTAVILIVANIIFPDRLFFTLG